VKNRRPVLRIRRTELAPCPVCGRPQEATVDGPCLDCITLAAQRDVRVAPSKPRTGRVAGMPKLKGDGLRVLDLETGELKYRVPQRVATARARGVIRDGGRREWAGR
jgi:hypothetical protein